MIISIQEKNRMLFEGLASLDILEDTSQNCYSFGCIGSDSGGKYAAGVLSFCIDSDDFGEVIAKIRWFYVSEAHRGEGVADELLTRLTQVLAGSGVDQVWCDVPMPEEYLMLSAYLESRGFTFSVETIYELRMTLEEAGSPALLQQQMRRDAIKPLERIPDTAFRQGIGAILEKLEEDGENALVVSEIRKTGLKKENYDNEISCALIKKDKLCALCLVRRHPSGTLEPVLLSGLGNITGRDMFALLCTALGEAQRICSPDTEVYVQCRRQLAAELIDYLYAGVQPPLVYRWYCTVEELLETMTQMMKEGKEGNEDGRQE